MHKFLNFSKLFLLIKIYHTSFRFSIVLLNFVYQGQSLHQVKIMQDLKNKKRINPSNKGFMHSLNFFINLARNPQSLPSASLRMLINLSRTTATPP